MEANLRRVPPRKRRVVLGMDGSKCAEEAFKWYAKKIHEPGDYLIVIHIPEKNPVMTSDGSSMTGIEDENQQVTRLRLAQFHELMKQHGIQGTVKHMSGEPGPQLVEAGAREGADFIITGSRGLGKLKRAFLGSVSDYVIRRSSVPALVCRLEDSLY
ncbi:uncharacterized protein LOC127880665 [Dreissena polymorpha]|uniref:UspA domain-containing protein n=1 Tax=Dreissena polymorpha TaxID=45954 RepID=A0A9D4GPC5_DREPO|nr:uncharacterized protein LOC127880665 [Dreissena polymorpha]XP_052283956.1 uncharacterized protein LOC127880665 [Dreissena polymorpha]XP_052283957.1 uncharacterized protein LOC127880665 [Dreissena polymorpha]KAH3819086.1 hypothetical protein DPMN_120817 [Dreissena polymorpha]